jgi:hypothetical protein
MLKIIMKIMIVKKMMEMILKALLNLVKHSNLN